LAGIWAAVLTFIARGPFLVHISQHWSSPWAAHVFGVMIVANAVLLSFTFLDEKISAAVSRWMFRTPDYRTCVRELSADLRKLESEASVAAAVERAASEALELSVARVVAAGDDPWPALLLEGEIVELESNDPLRKRLNNPNVELLVPISPGGHLSHVLEIAPGPARPRLLTNDFNFLRRISFDCGNRFDALRHEREAIERRSREALLEQQVTEAELRALRAQVNPHFLFNSLNTIADLIVRNPGRAEEMTVRLATVFRHVLTHSSRPLTTIRDEVEFLRTYLHLEEARFGDRLRVDIEVDPIVEPQQIPSLILQPLVENSLKYAVAPREEGGRLRIEAREIDGRLRLVVQDDGPGLPVGVELGAGRGVGFRNTRERLAVLYGDQQQLAVRFSRPGLRLEITMPFERAAVPA